MWAKTLIAVVVVCLAAFAVAFPDPLAAPEADPRYGYGGGWGGGYRGGWGGGYGRGWGGGYGRGYGGGYRGGYGYGGGWRG